MAQKKEEISSVRHKVLTIIGAILCVILIPILVINVTLIIKSYTNKDEVPKLGGFCPLIVLTESMDPVIKSGDLIIVKQIDGKDVSVGDIIAFYDPDGNGKSILTHRVTSIEENNGILSFRTKGDANNTEDKKSVPEDKLVGRYKKRIPKAGHAAMFMQTTAGLVICVLLPLLMLIGYDVIRRRSYDKQNQQDTVALLAELEALKAEKKEKEISSQEDTAPAGENDPGTAADTTTTETDTQSRNKDEDKE
ncbi:MAG: signal peptidase I [Ruminococcus sp.]|nr:signal peptidase I [Ruminococcus sp.]